MILPKSIDKTFFLYPADENEVDIFLGNARPQFRPA